MTQLEKTGFGFPDKSIEGIWQGVGLETKISRRAFILGSLGVAGALAATACEGTSKPFLSPSPSPPPSPTPEKPIFPTPEKYTSIKFLTNPFPNDTKMKIQQGWFYNWPDEKTGNPAKHQGIDFIKGEISDTDASTWKPFDVLAAADGWLCANPPLRLGNALFITHLVNGNFYYTYYGHLEKMEKGIPLYDGKKEFLGGVPVRRGEKIGVAGASGVTNEKGEPELTWIHLHFGAQDANGPLDPYDLHGERGMYPNPNSLDIKNLGPRSLWK